MRIVITSKQRPYYGGSATNAYKLTKYLRQIGFKVAIIFFNNDDVNVDPDNIGGVFKSCHNSKLKIPISNINHFNNEEWKENLQQLIHDYLGDIPELVLAFNYYVPVISKNIFPNIFIVYMVVGSPVLTLGKNCIINNNISCQKFLTLTSYSQYIENKFYKLEKETIEISDFILVDHGNLLLDVLKKLYPNLLQKKLYSWYDYSSLIIKNDLLQMSKSIHTKKDYDLICIASNWDRKVKNANFLLKIYNNFRNMNKIIIGKKSNIFSNIENTEIHGLLDYNKIIYFLSKSKLLLITSYFESGPNLIIEAKYCNCNILASENIGKSYLLNDENKCQDVYNLNEWYKKINLIVNY